MDDNRNEEPIVQYANRTDSNNRLKVAGVIALLFLIGLVTWGLFFRQPKTIVQTPQAPAQVRIPTPTPTPTIDKTTVRIQVLNGTGTVGEAAVVVEALEAEGFDSDNIISTNADVFDNTTTTISMREDYEGIAIDIQDILEQSFNDVEIESTPLGQDSKYDVIIITGLRNSSTSPAVTQTPSQAPTSEPTVTITPTATPTP